MEEIQNKVLFIYYNPTRIKSVADVMLRMSHWRNSANSGEKERSRMINRRDFSKEKNERKRFLFITIYES